MDFMSKENHTNKRVREARGPEREGSAANDQAAIAYTHVMPVRLIQLNPRADRILDSVAEAYGGDPDVALSELLIAHQSIESFFDEFEAENSAELKRQRDQSKDEFEKGLTIPWEQVKLDNGL